VSSPDGSCVQLRVQWQTVAVGRAEADHQAIVGGPLGGIGCAVGPACGVRVEQARASCVRQVADHESRPSRWQQRVIDPVA